MITAIVGFSLLLFSFFRAVSSNDALIWIREFNRILLALLLIGFSFSPEWGFIAIVLDAAFMMVCFFAMRITVQAQGEEQ